MSTTRRGKERLVLGKDEIVHRVAASAGMSLKDTLRILNAFTEVVQEGLARGQEIRLMGFGTWSIRSTAARRVKSIRSGDQILIPEKCRVGFSVGAVLAQAAFKE